MSIQDQVPTGTTPKLPPQAHMVELISSLWKTHVTGAIARLGIPDLLAPGPRTAAELAAALSADADATARLLRAGASLGLLDVDPPDRYVLTPLGECLVTGPSTFRDYAILMTDASHARPLEHLAQAITTGQSTARAVLGQDIWDYLREHPDEAAHFAGAMTGLAAVSAPVAAAQFDATPYRRIVDVGGGHDFLLRALLAGAPEAHGVLFDLPEVIAGAEASIAAPEKPGPCIETASGSFFDGVPADGDLYILAHVLHDWDDTAAVQILHNCHRAGNPGHSLAVLEMLLPDGLGDWLPFLLDMHMLVINGGRERTAGEFRALLAEADYQVERIIRLAGGQNILLARA